jgi:hypothetical protein
VRGLVFDPLLDPGFRARLAPALERGATFAGEGARWALAPVAGGAAAIESLPSRLVPGEHSNSSVI